MLAFQLLWLPMLLSAIAVFIVSSIIHMATPWHKGDFRKLPDEDGVMRALRPFAIPPAEYLMPRPASAGDMKSPEYLAKRNEGPVVLMTVYQPGPFNMGKFMGQWFLFLLVVSAAVGVLGWAALGRGAPEHRIFHIIAYTTFLAYAVATWPISIWYQRPWATTFRTTIDGLIYAIVTGLIFVWLWPGL
jgi:hypothetical protein